MRYLSKSPNLKLKQLPLALAAVFCGLAANSHAGTTIQTVSYEYDPVSGLKTADVREPDNAQLHLKQQYTYDTFGNRLTTVVSSNATGTAAITTRTVETRTFDANGKAPASSTNAIGQTMYGTFDPNNLPLMIQNLNGLQVTSLFDSFGRKTSETRPDGTKTRFSYGLCGAASAGYMVCTNPYAKYVTVQRQVNITSDSAAFGQGDIAPWVKTYYDELGRTVRTETLAFDGVTVITQETEYDAFGRVSRISRPYFPNGVIQWQTNTYDALGRVIATTFADNTQEKKTYNGLTLVETNRLNQTRTTVNNAIGQMVQVTDHQGSSVTFQYDSLGNLLKTTDPKGNTVSMTYDALGRKTSMSDPDLGNISYSYDALGQLLKQTDARNNITSLTYDLLGRVTNRTEADLTSTWTYDTCLKGKGRLCSTTADNGYSASYTFDSLGRPSQTTTYIDRNYTVGTTYNANGQIDTRTYPTGLVLKYVYSAFGFLTEVRNNTSNALYWQANQRDAENHLLQQTYGNNVVTQQTFDPATGRIKTVKAGAANGVQNLSFTYDAGGNLFSRTDANQSLSESFLYDSLNRITSNTINATAIGLQTQTYGYDSIGDITSRSDVGTYTYGLVNNRPHGVAEIALAAGGKRQYTYDANGNLTQEVQRDAAGAIIASKGRTTSWTSFNMPASISSPAATLSFVYGSDHQRIKQTSPTERTYYVHPDNAGGLSYERQYIIATGATEHRHYITAGDAGVIAMIKQTDSGTSTVYMHRDHLGSTTATTNDSGAVIERFAYEPFGQRRKPSGATTPGIVGATTDRGFTNHEHLDEVGLVHMNGRLYDPTIGRFMSADPNIPHPTNVQSYNRYSYTRNNPLKMVDPTGFFESADFGCGGSDYFSECDDSSDGGGSGSAGNEISPQEVANALSGTIQDGVATVRVTGERTPVTNEITVVVTQTNDPFASSAAPFNSPISNSRGEVDSSRTEPTPRAVGQPRSNTIRDPNRRNPGVIPGSVLTIDDLKKMWKTLRLPDYVMVGIPSVIPGAGLSITVDRYGQVFVGPTFGVGLPNATGKPIGVGWIGQPDRPTADQLKTFLSGTAINSGVIFGINWSDPFSPGSGAPNRAGLTIGTPGVGISTSVPFISEGTFPKDGIW